MRAFVSHTQRTSAVARQSRKSRKLITIDRSDICGDYESNEGAEHSDSIPVSPTAALEKWAHFSRECSIVHGKNEVTQVNWVPLAVVWEEQAENGSVKIRAVRATHHHSPLIFLNEVLCHPKAETGATNSFRRGKGSNMRAKIALSIPVPLLAMMTRTPF